jgi:hypothetical protein
LALTSGNDVLIRMRWLTASTRQNTRVAIVFGRRVGGNLSFRVGHRPVVRRPVGEVMEREGTGDRQPGRRSDSRTAGARDACEVIPTPRSVAQVPALSTDRNESAKRADDDVPSRQNRDPRPTTSETTRTRADLKHALRPDRKCRTGAGCDVGRVARVNRSIRGRRASPAYQPQTRPGVRISGRRPCWSSASVLPMG